MKDLLLRRKWAFALYLFACFFPVINQLLSNYALSLLIGSATSGELQVFWQNLWLSFAMMMTSSLVFLASRFMRIGFMRDIILDLRQVVFGKIQGLSYEAFYSRSRSEYLSHLINDINLFEETFFNRLLNLVFRGGAYIASLVILAFYSPAFALVILVTSLLVFALMRTLEHRTEQLQEAISTENSRVTTDIQNTFDGLTLLKLNRVETAFLNKNLQAIDRLESKKREYHQFTEGQRFLTRTLNLIIFVGILLYALSLLEQGVSATQMTFMIVLANGCIWPLEQVFPMLNELRGSLKIFKKMTAFDENTARLPEGVEAFSLKKGISLEHVSFGYSDTPILKDVNLVLEHGKKYLVKGASGAGKSTLIKLISRTYGNFDGEITLDGTNLLDIQSEDFNRHVAFIDQDVFLFEDTLMNNIALYHPLSHQRLEKAIASSGLTDLVSGDERGLQRTLTENGKNLSGGQRQRIAIARALAKQVDVLFADEATSSLDPLMGAQIEETLLGLPCTLLAISHRYYPGITERYDGVIVVKNGRVQMVSTEDYFAAERRGGVA